MSSGPLPVIATVTAYGASNWDVFYASPVNSLAIDHVPIDDGALQNPRVVVPTGLSAIGKAIGAVQKLFKGLASYLKSQGKNIANDVTAGLVVLGITKAAKYGVNAVTNAVTSVANAAPAAEQGVVDSLNAQSPGLGTAAQDVVNTIGSESASAYNSTITDISQIIDENGNINWSAIFNDLGPLGG